MGGVPAARTFAKKKILARSRLEVRRTFVYGRDAQ